MKPEELDKYVLSLREVLEEKEGLLDIASKILNIIKQHEKLSEYDVSNILRYVDWSYMKIQDEKRQHETI